MHRAGTEDEGLRPDSASLHELMFGALPFIGVGTIYFFDFGDVGWWIGASIFVGLGAIASAMAARAARHTSRRELANATALVQRLRELKAGEEPSRFCLYLRPFSINGLVPVRNPEHSSLSLRRGYYRRGLIDLESAVRIALADLGEPVAIGSPAEMAKLEEAVIPAIRAKHDDDPSAAPHEVWTAQFALLAQKARMILVVPWDTPGCVRELAELKDRRLLERCVFIMPKELLKADRRARVDADAWARIRDAIDGCCGLEAPDLTDDGFAYTLRSDGSLAELRTPLQFSRMADAQALVGELVS